MSLTRNSALFIFLFAAFILIMRLYGLIDFSVYSLMAVASLVTGFIFVYYAFGDSKKGLLFAGVVLFLSGVMFLIDLHSPLAGLRHLALPSAFFISGAAFLFVYLSDTSKPLLLLTGLFLAVVPVVYALLVKRFDFAAVYDGLTLVADRYWVMLVLFGIALVMLLNQDRLRKALREEKKQNEMAEEERDDQGM